MTMKETYYRRSVLRGTAGAAGIGSLAGCSFFSENSNEATPTTDGKRPYLNVEPVVDAPRWVGPLASRPKTGEQTGHEYFVDRGPQEGALYVWRDGAWRLMNEHAKNGSFATVNGVRSASEYAKSGQGTPDDPWVLDNNVMPPGGAVSFGPGQYTSDGLETPPKPKYEQTAVYLEGAGVRTTTLHAQPTDGSLVTFNNKWKEYGNFGGVSDMSVLGLFPDEKQRSPGHLIHGTGKVIDTLYENLIVRYSWGDGIRLEGSSSGTRIRNSWIENNFGWNVYLGSGTRPKLSNLHIISGKKGGIHFSPSYGQLSNLSFTNCAPSIELAGINNAVSNVFIEKAVDGPAIRERAENGNVVTNVTIKESKAGIITDGVRSQYTNINISTVDREAIQLNGSGLSVTALAVSGFGQNDSGAPAIDCSGSDCRVLGGSLSQSNGKKVAARISGKRNKLSQLHCHGSTPWRLIVTSNAVDTVLDSVQGVTLSSLQDSGKRTLLNRQGTNAGDPRSTGEWNGHGGYAGSMGATVWDTHTTPWTPFRADGAGRWLPIG